MKRIASIFLFLCLVISSAACGRSADGQAMTASNGSSQDTATTKDGYGYHIQYDALPMGMTVSSAQWAYGDSIYLAGYSEGDVLHFGRSSPGGSEEYEVPENVDHVHAITVFDDELWILAGDRPRRWIGASNMFQENEQDRYELFLIGYDLKGNMMEVIEVDGSLEDGTRYISLRYHDGYYYVLSRTGLYQLSEDGRVKNSKLLEGREFFGQAVSDENYYVCYFSSTVDNGNDAVNIDVLTSSQDLSFETILSDKENDIAGIGVDGAGAVLVNTQRAIAYTDGAFQDQIYSFYENGIMDSIYDEIIPFDGGYLLTAPSQSRIAKLVYGPISTEKTVLKLWATAETVPLISLVEDFNVSNPNYTIMVETEYDLGPERIRADIMAGKGPDIYALVETLNFNEMSDSAIFEDIYPYLENSPVYSKEDLVPSVIKALEVDDSLYVLPLDFSVWTMVERTDLPGTGGLLDALSLPQVIDGSMTVFPQTISQSDMFYWLSNMYLNDHMKDGECDFDTEEYCAILKACASMPMRETDGAPSIYSVENIARLLRLLYLQETYGDGYTFQSGLGSCLSVSQSLAIANTSTNKEGAWEFLQFALSYDLTKTDDAAFPVLISKLDTMLEEASTDGVWRYKTNRFEKLTPHSQKEIETLIKSTYVALDQYPPLIEIMKEEAAKYFCGDRDIEETVQITQSRANIYLAEQYG